MTHRQSLDRAVTRLSGGDKSALPELYAEMNKAVFVLALSIVRDYHQAEDIMQDTFIHVQNHAAAYRKGSNAKAWILSITRNLSCDFIRLRKKEVPNEHPLILLKTDINESNDYSRKIESTVDFQKAMECLNEEERQIVILRVLGRLSHKEIGSMLGAASATIRQRYSRALKKLKKYYQSD